ncbi:MBL fold metallo-hydrolase [Gemmatimonadota bacterium]
MSLSRVAAVFLVLLFQTFGCVAKHPGITFEKISASLYRVNDACNVYLVKRGDRALLIDSGDGHVLELLNTLGVDKTDWVLHTHAHRDQCQGTPLLVETGAEVAVPEREERFFTDATGFWDNFQLFYRYSYKPDQFKPRENIPVHRTLRYGESFEWEGLSFETVDAPGHTVGSAAYLVELDGRRYAFTGDMIHSPGKLWNLYSFDYKYWDGGFQGITSNLEALERILSREPDILLPSHGTTIENPTAAVEKLRANLERLYDLAPVEETAYGSSGPSPPRRWKKISEHLYHYPTSFILLSRDSSALFYDYYAVPDSGSRYHYSALDTLIAALGIKTVELAIPSHFHEDHIRGFLDLKRRFGTKIPVFENLVDILANPSHYNLPCLAEESITADRIIHHGEVLRWKEYEFTVVHFPGQTMYHQGMVGRVDGKKVFFCGDTDVYTLDAENLTRRNLKLHGISTFLNYYLLEPGKGYLKALDQLIEHNPEMLLYAHSGAKNGSLEMYLRNRENLERRIEAVAQILPFEDSNFGFDPNWVCFYPYHAKVEPGDDFKTVVRVRNHLPRAMNVSVALRHPKGWVVDPPERSVSVDSKSTVELSFKIGIPEEEVLNRRIVITAEVKTDQRDWGEFAEMLLEKK